MFSARDVITNIYPVDRVRFTAHFEVHTWTLNMISGVGIEWVCVMATRWYFVSPSVKNRTRRDAAQAYHVHGGVCQRFSAHKNALTLPTGINNPVTFTLLKGSISAKCMCFCARLIWASHLRAHIRPPPSIHLFARKLGYAKRSDTCITFCRAHTHTRFRKSALGKYARDNFEHDLHGHNMHSELCLRSVPSRYLQVRARFARLANAGRTPTGRPGCVIMNIYEWACLRGAIATAVGLRTGACLLADDYWSQTKHTHRKHIGTLNHKLRMKRTWRKCGSRLFILRVRCCWIMGRTNTSIMLRQFTIEFAIVYSILASVIAAFKNKVNNKKCIFVIVGEYWIKSSWKVVR